jgi:hypothetical protein
MFVLPPAAEPLIRSFAGALTRPSFARFSLLLVGAIVTFGRRTVSRILWTLGPAAATAGHPSSFHRFFSHARLRLWPMGQILAAAVIGLLPADAPILLAVDDTVFGHRGKTVYGKGCHRDAVRSPRDPDHVVKKWGHKWVVLAVLVPLPFATRRCWALPVLCALYRVPRVDEAEGRRHKTPCDLARQLVSALLHGFPTRRFVLLGDGGFASHDLAWFCHRHQQRLTLIARGRGDLNLHALVSPDDAKPPCRQTLWRRRVGISQPPRCRKGAKLPAPRDTVAAARRGRGLAPGGGVLPMARVQWYGQSRRELELFSACGGWYRGRGNGSGALAPIRWLYTHDPQTGKEDWFLCTDPTYAPSAAAPAAPPSPAAIVEDFAGRWSLEVTFEEGRAHLGWETTRQRCAASVLRCGPCLIGLFSVVSLIFIRLWRSSSGSSGSSHKGRWMHHTPCYHKAEPTFADALYAVRRMFWDGCLLKHVLGPRRVTTLPRPLKQTLITYLAEAG